MIPLGVLASARVVAAGGGGGLVLTDTLTNTTNSASYQWTAVNIGEPHPDRTVILCIRTPASASRSFSGLTVNGTAVTPDACTASGEWFQMSVAALHLPTGTTIDVAATINYAANNASLHAFAIPRRLVKGATRAGNATPATATLPTTSGGLVIAAAYLPDSPTPVAWSGVGDVHSVAVESRYHYALIASGTGSDVTITAPAMGTVAAVAYSWEH